MRINMYKHCLMLVTLVKIKRLLPYPVTTAAIKVPAMANVKMVPKLRKKFRFLKY